MLWKQILQSYIFPFTTVIYNLKHKITFTFTLISIIHLTDINILQHQTSLWSKWNVKSPSILHFFKNININVTESRNTLQQYLSSKIFHVRPKFTEQVIPLMKEGQMSIHEGQHLKGKIKIAISNPILDKYLEVL